MFTIRKQFKFECAHKLHQAFSKGCVEQIHGHSYIVEVYLRSPTLDLSGMVMDFGELKELVGEYFKRWDHSLILNREDVNRDNEEILREFNKNLRIVDWNPTAEEMAREFYEFINAGLEKRKPEVILWKVRVHETTTGWAEFEQ